MKFSLAATSILLLLPLGALASPVAVAGDYLSPTRTGALGPRTSYVHHVCKIVNVNTSANCRSGPGTNYPTKYYPKKGVAYQFSCYKRGTCVSGNCTWDKLVYSGGSCYVSGALTDSQCTMNNLGPC